MLTNIPQYKSHWKYIFYLKYQDENQNNNTKTLTRYHCFVNKGSFMLMSISLMSLYPLFFRLNPSCCKAIFTCNDNCSILHKYQPACHHAGIFFPMNSKSFLQWKLHLFHLHSCFRIFSPKNSHFYLC